MNTVELKQTRKHCLTFISCSTMCSIYILYINWQGQGIEHTFSDSLPLLYSSLKKVYAMKRHGGNLNAQY